ncbi:MAG: cyclic nucleotide-binding protein [Cereibacter sphaeroides]|uniref:Cyclic nucleotide-binding protein n=1 Tax=Cereibacter sphaeroides TaxID=1063 RepID=A0A2W5S934_CERSP|nr:MAG: cyclic nucleotide-binding protein [Cereibacter sphaeroides]
MLLHDEVSVLRGVPLFAGMETSKLKLLAFASDRVIFEPGHILYRKGDSADSAYVILSGEVDLIDETPGGQVNVGTSGARTVVGEVAILSDKPRAHTVQARSRVETLRITKDHFHKLLACCPGTMAQIIRVLGERMALAS